MTLLGRVSRHVIDRLVGGGQVIALDGGRCIVTDRVVLIGGGRFLAVAEADPKLRGAVDSVLRI